MTTILTIPRLEMSMTEGTLAQWLVENGAVVKEGDPLYVLETEKASQDIAAPASGRLTQKLQPGGEPLAVGTEIGEILP